MIEFIPAEISGDTVTYEAKENDKIIGKCSASFGGYDTSIISYDGEDDIALEGLFRSVFNFCANNGAFLAHISSSQLCPALMRLGFSDTDLVKEIPDVLASTCCSCHNK